MGRVIDTHRDTHLRGTDHIDTRLIAFEDLEYLTQEACSQQHAARLDLDGGDIILSGDSLDLTILGLV